MIMLCIRDTPDAGKQADFVLYARAVRQPFEHCGVSPSRTICRPSGIARYRAKNLHLLMASNVGAGPRPLAAFFARRPFPCTRRPG